MGMFLQKRVPQQTRKQRSDDSRKGILFHSQDVHLLGHSGGGVARCELLLVKCGMIKLAVVLIREAMAAAVDVPAAASEAQESDLLAASITSISFL